MVGSDCPSDQKSNEIRTFPGQTTGRRFNSGRCSEALTTVNCLSNLAHLGQGPRPTNYGTARTEIAVQVEDSAVFRGVQDLDVLPARVHLAQLAVVIELHEALVRRDRVRPDLLSALDRREDAENGISWSKHKVHQADFFYFSSEFFFVRNTGNFVLSIRQWNKQRDESQSNRLIWEKKPKVTNLKAECFWPIKFGFVPSQERKIIQFWFVGSHQLSWALLSVLFFSF